MVLSDTNLALITMCIFFDQNLIIVANVTNILNIFPRSHITEIVLVLNNDWVFSLGV